MSDSRSSPTPQPLRSDTQLAAQEDDAARASGVELRTRSVWRGPALPLLVALLAGLVLHLRGDPALEGVPRIDEAEWLGMSTHTWQLLVTGESRDQSAPAPRGSLSPEAAPEDPWLTGIQVSTFGWMNPLLPKLVFGAVAASAGVTEADRLLYPRFAKDARDPVRAKARARERLLPALAPARGVTLVLAALSAGLLFAIGRRLAGPVAGATAAALWCLSPAVLDSAHWVRTDLFPLTANLAALALVVARPREVAGLAGRRAQLVGALVLGVAVGVAVGSKLNGALLAFALLAWLPLLWSLAPRTERPSFAAGPLRSLLLAGAVSLALFLLLSPRLWSDPLGGLAETLERWSNSTQHQQRNLSAAGEVAVARTLGEKLRLALGGTLGRDEPLRALFDLGGGALLLLGGLALLTLAARGSRAGPPGSGATGADERFAARARGACTLAWILVTVAGTTLWLPIDWPRFFLPFLAPMVLLEALVLADLVRRVAGLRRRPG